jgi:hypothetical protein
MRVKSRFFRLREYLFKTPMQKYKLFRYLTIKCNICRNKEYLHYKVDFQTREIIIINIEIKIACKKF